MIARLRAAKDRGGLSTRRLAAETGYSARSWQRYLNGGSLPPAAAVEALARVTGDDPVRLLALREAAAEHWTRGRPLPAGPDAQDDPAVPPPPPPTERFVYGRYPRALVTAGAAALVLSVSLALVLAVRLADTREQLAHARADTVAAAPATVSASLVPVVYPCRPRRDADGDGTWYAGLSRTSTAILAYTHVGPEVAEAQCLLRRTGIPPGDIDGVFGPKTQRAVERVQRREGLVVDGVIGPHTWKALREADAE